MIVVRQEVSNFDSSIVVHELELAINRALYGEPYDANFVLSSKRNLTKNLNMTKLGGRGGGTDTISVCQTVSVEIKYKNATFYTMKSMWYNQQSEIYNNNF